MKVAFPAKRGLFRRIRESWIGDSQRRTLRSWSRSAKFGHLLITLSGGFGQRE